MGLMAGEELPNLFDSCAPVFDDIASKICNTQEHVKKPKTRGVQAMSVEELWESCRGETRFQKKILHISRAIPLVALNILRNVSSMPRFERHRLFL